MKYLNKDIPRGSARLAEGASLLQEGNDPKDHAHVSRPTPWDTKKKEIAEGLQYEAMNKAREQSTTAKRPNKDTRPL